MSRPAPVDPPSVELPEDPRPEGDAVPVDEVASLDADADALAEGLALADVLVVVEVRTESPSSPGSWPRQTLIAMTSAATATTAMIEGTSAAVMSRRVRWAPRRWPGVETFIAVRR
jgi:hypothetical protein